MMQLDHAVSGGDSIGEDVIVVEQLAGDLFGCAILCLGVFAVVGEDPYAGFLHELDVHQVLFASDEATIEHENIDFVIHQREPQRHAQGLAFPFSHHHRNFFHLRHRPSPQ